MRIYRICREKRAKSLAEAFDGVGASQFGGRWNPKGMSAAYTSGTTSLALLEVLVHADLEDLPDDLVSASVNILDDVKIFELAVNDLPENWRDIDPAPLDLAVIGKKWIKEEEFLLMSVPSVIIPDEKNFILNPEHKSFVKLSDFRVQSIEIDSRLRINLV
jgi:RES domain-containing protein